jgi:hypothetical protein
MKIKILSLTLAATVGATLQAKGMDELTPAVGQAPEGQPDAENPTPAETPPAAEPATPAPATPTPPALPTAPAAAVEPALPEVKVERSAISKKIENRLFASIGLGFGTFDASKGDWTAEADSDLGVGWRLKPEPQKWNYYVTGRFSPLSVVVKSGNESYRGVAAGYHLGVLGEFSYRENLRPIAGAELGYWTTSLHALDYFAESTSLESGGMTITAMGGIDWILLQKIRVGPRLLLGMGRFKYMRMSTTATFVF